MGGPAYDPDARGLVYRHTLINGATGEPRETITRTYTILDPLTGQPLQTQRGDIATKQIYEDDATTPGNIIETKVIYDPHDLRPDAETAYNYASDGHLTQTRVLFDEGNALVTGYDAAGRVDTLTAVAASGVTMSETFYDDANRGARHVMVFLHTLRVHCGRASLGVTARGGRETGGGAFIPPPFAAGAMNGRKQGAAAPPSPPHHAPHAADTATRATWGDR